MKIRLVGAELFHADVQTERHDEANNRFFFFKIITNTMTLMDYPLFQG